MTEATFLAAAGVTTADALANGARGRRDRELAQVRRVAEAAQQVLLRPVPRQAGPVRLAAVYLSASPGARVGRKLLDIRPAAAASGKGRITGAAAAKNIYDQL